MKCLSFVAGVVFPFLLFCAVPLSGQVYDSVEDVPGADMGVYDLYQVSKGSGDEEKAVEYAELFLASIDTSAVCAALAGVYDYLADYEEMDKFKFSKAIALREQSLRIYEGLEDGYNAAEEEYHIAKLYYKRGEFHMALKFASRAWSHFEEVDYNDGSALDCLNLLGCVYYICQDFDKAQRYYIEYARQARLSDDSIRQVLAMNNMSLSSKDPEKRKQFMEESIAIAGSSGDSSRLVRLYINYSTWLLDRGQWQEASAYLDLAEPLLANIEQSGEWWQNKGVLYAATGRDADAEECLKNAIRDYSQGEFELMQLYCLEALHGIYAREGRWKDAYDVLMEYNRLDSIHAGDSMYLALFRTQNEIELRIQQMSDERERNRQTLIFVCLSFGLVILALTTLILYLKNKYRMRQKETELAGKHEALEMQKMQQFQTRKMIDETINRLRDVGMEASGDVRGSIGRICDDLNDAKNEKEWQETNKYIPEFNGEFMQKLMKSFPQLTVGERRLCALLHLNLSTKEICEITRQSPQTVNMARYRLRKKLNITHKNMEIGDWLNEVCG